MNKDLIPMYHYKTAADITFSDINSWGVEAVVIDIDNTICYDATRRFISGSKQWVEEIKSKGIPMMIVSNAGRRRAMKIAETLGLECIPLAKKPKHEPFYRAAKMLETDIEKIAFIGDQIFSDVKGANEVGAVSVYVEPPSREVVFYFFYRYKRHKEKPVIKQMLELESKSGVSHKVR